MPLPAPILVVLAVAAFAGHYALPRRWQNAWLLLVSYGVVGLWGWPVAALLAASTLLNLALGRRVRAEGRPRRGVLALGLAANLLLLLHFKLADFYLPGLAALAAQVGLADRTGARTVLAPLGLSYYTLQAIAYLVAVYQGRLAPAPGWVAFPLYLAYFPKLIAGPLEPPGQFLAQLEKPRIVDNAAVARGAGLIVLGLFRKIVLADVLFGYIPDLAFHRPFLYGRLDLALALAAYAFALYNDFAGYTNLARGVSALFGLELSPNFAQPFFARSFGEFWNRWHISLSHWLREYVFFPLSRALRRRWPDRTHPVNVLVPPLVVMLASAAWHFTAAHKMVLVWGGLHGLYLAGEQWLARGGPALPPDRWPRWRQALGALVVFSLTSLAWVPFRPGIGLWHTLNYWRSLFINSVPSTFDARVLVVIALSLGLDWLQARTGDEVFVLRWPLWARALTLAAVSAAIGFCLAPVGVTPFVYQGF